MPAFSLSQLRKFKRAELQAACKQLDIKASGKNVQLIESLLPYVVPEDEVSTADTTSTEGEEETGTSEQPAGAPETFSSSSATLHQTSEQVSSHGKEEENRKQWQAEMRGMVQEAVLETQKALESAFHERLEGMERQIERQQGRIGQLEKQQQQYSAQPAAPASISDTPRLHLTEPSGHSYSGQMDQEGAEEEEEVADSLSPLPKRPRWSNAPAPSSQADLSSPFGAASTVATLGVPTPGRRSPLPSADKPFSALKQNVQSSKPAASAATPAQPFSFLTEGGKAPPAPLSPPRPANSTAQTGSTGSKENVPLHALPVPLHFNPFKLSPQKPTSTTIDTTSNTQTQSMPTFLAPASPKGHQNSNSTSRSHFGPMRRSPARFNSRPPPPPSTASKNYAGVDMTPRNKPLFADLGEAAASTSSWAHWL